MSKRPLLSLPKSFDQQLTVAWEKLGKSVDIGESKHIILGLVFLRFISDYIPDKIKNVFSVPPQAKWEYLKENYQNPEIGKILDEAMEAIEAENPSIKGLLPKVYNKENISPIKLGNLINLFSNFDFDQIREKTSDILGYVFEYFLGQIALAEGRKGGEFYTPRTVVDLLVEILQPYQGIVFDPCCGTGGMFIQSEKFIEAHQGKTDSIRVYGQEINQTTWRLCKINLIIRGIDASQVKWNSEGSFLNDAHKDLKADFVIANPPFNLTDWGGELLENDPRWQYGTPPIINANYAWIQHFIYHLNSKGKAGFVHCKATLVSKMKKEYEIRKNLIENDLVECIVNLPDRLFLNTNIPVCLWFINKNKKRKGQILFIDASNAGKFVNGKVNKILETEDIQKIAGTYHKWQKGKKGKYQDIAGFCKSASLEEVRNLNYILSPENYVGYPKEKDNFNFWEMFSKLKNEITDQFKKEEHINQLILNNLERINKKQRHRWIQKILRWIKYLKF